MTLNITPMLILESTIMYGIVHAIWWFIKKGGQEAFKEARRNRNHIIHNHVKIGHGGRLKHCIDDACASLRKPSPVVPVQQQEAHTE